MYLEARMSPREGKRLVTVAVITDSTSCLTADAAAEASVMVAPLFVTEDGVATPDTEIDFDRFYDRLASMATLPGTAQSSLDDLTKAFRSAAASGRDAVGIFISEAMSGTCQAARIAAQAVHSEFPDARLEVVDSRSNSMQLGFAVLSAAEASAEGRTIDECIDACEQTMRRTRYLFAPHTLEYLRRGGRIGGASALVGGLLQITPILTVSESTTQTFAKVRTHAKALATIADTFASEIEQYGLRRVVVHFIADREIAAEFAAQKIEPVVGAPVKLVAVVPTIGVHVGPAVALAYETERPLRDAVSACELQGSRT